MKNIIYLLYYCDNWKAYDSMKLAVATTNKETLISTILELDKKGDMEFYQGTEDLTTMSTNDINNNLAYGYIQEVNDGEWQ